MNAALPRRTRHVSVDSDSLPQVWHAHAVGTRPQLLMASVAVGVLGMFGLLTLSNRWSFIALVLIVVGAFGGHGLVTRSIYAPERPASERGFLELLRGVIDLIAIAAGVGAAILVLAFVFGGRVGVMRG